MANNLENHLKMENIRQQILDRKGILSRLLFGSFWSALGNILNRASGLILSISVARIIGPDYFGEFSIIRSTIMTLLTFGGAGISVVATKFIAETRIVNPNKAENYALHAKYLSAILATSISLILIAGAEIIATQALHTPNLAQNLRLAALVIFFNAINSCQTGTLAGYESFRLTALINIMNGFLSLLLVISGAYLYGVAGAVIGMALTSLATVVISERIINIRIIKSRSNGHKLDKSILIEMLKFGIPVTLSGILVTPVLWACNAMLVRSPNGMREVALFEAANQWRMLILFVPLLVAQVSLPVLSSIKEKHQLWRALRFTILATAIISTLVALPVFLFPHWLMQTYGSSFQNADIVLKWLAISSVLMAVNNVIGQAIASQNKAWHGFGFNLLWAVTILSSSSYLISRNLGSTGLAIAQTIAYATHSVLQISYIIMAEKKQKNNF